MIWLLLLVVIAGLLISWTQTHLREELQSHFERTRVRQALLVISHPDDESMFFSPILEFLTNKGIGVEVLCLSNGNANGLGRTREDELYSALTSSYRIKPSSVTILDSEAMQDGMSGSEQWDDTEVKNAIVDHVKLSATPIHLVISFDDYGVSGHQNHISTHRGLKKAYDFWSFAKATSLSNSGEEKKDSDASEETLPAPSEVWYLESVSLWRKYSGLLDIVATLIFQEEGDRKLSILFSNPAVAWLGMLHHQSQLEWYRYLFVAFSRYSYINTVQVVHV